MKWVLICYCIIFSSYSYAAPKKLTEKQTQFIQKMVPAICATNVKYHKMHQLILHYQSLWQANNHLNSVEKMWLLSLAARFNLPFVGVNRRLFQQLSLRVNIIPASLVLAQAINESAWGQSRFARQAHNYFGQWCSQPQCGLKPKDRSSQWRFAVQKFPTRQASVAAYFLNLNRNSAHKQLWQIRRDFLSEKKTMNLGVQMAVGLSNYSERGVWYVSTIQHIILQYDLGQYAQCIPKPHEDTKL